jgi:3-phenylpropionate/trans-cinnamate dioxygenase ferredoxin subunit
MENEYFAVLDEKELQDGTMKLVRFEGEPLLFIKQNGKIFVIDNRCPHMGCGFSGGALEGMVIICPCHDWRFNLESGVYEEDSEFVLKKYEWKIKEGKIWVKLDE